MSTYASSSWRDASKAWDTLIAAAADAVRGITVEHDPSDRPGRDEGSQRRQDPTHGHGQRQGQEPAPEHDAEDGHGSRGGHGSGRGHGSGHGKPRADRFDRSGDEPGFPFGAGDFFAPGGLFGPPGHRGDGGDGGDDADGGPGGHGGHGRRRGGGFGPRGGPWQARGRGRGRGARRRGDVRAAILVLLDEQPRHGYELITEISDRSGGVWRPSPGTVYPTLSQLEDEGLIRLERLDGRKTATLTDEGRAYVEDNRAQLGTPWSDVAGNVRAENLTLRAAIAQVGVAASTVALHGSPEQATRAAEILEQARGELYGLMAEPKAGADPASPADPPQANSDDDTPETSE